MVAPSKQNQENENETVGSIREFVARIPQAVKERKIEDIAPGAIHDPVAKLFRYAIQILSRRTIHAAI